MDHIAILQLFLISFAMTIPSLSDSTPSDVKRYNYGILFKYDGQSTPKVGYWSHTYHSILPTLEQWRFVDNWCLHSEYEAVCSQFPYLIRLAVTFANHTQLQFRHNLKAAYDLLPNTPLPRDFSRSKRSLLPFIGQISKSLFGTATEADVEILEKHVRSISQSQSQLLTGFQKQSQHLSSFMSLSQERMNDFEIMLKQQYAELLDTILTNRKRTQLNTENLAFVLYRMFSKLYDYLILQNQVQDLYNAVELLTLGSLPAYLIPASVLKHTIKEIDSNLVKSYTNVRLLHRDPTHYYTSHDFLYFRNGSDLYITVKFPTGVIDISLLSTYSVVTFPVVFHNDSSLFTILTTSVHHFLMSTNHHYFVELDQHTPVLEKFSVDTVRNFSQSTCLLALFIDDPVLIKSLCKFQVVHSNSFTQDIYVINYPEIVIKTSQPVKIVCNQFVRQLAYCSYCVYTVPCACGVITSLTYLPPRFSQCDVLKLGHPFTVSPMYPVNLALLQHFFENDSLNAFSGDTLLSQPLPVKLPDMKFYNHSFEDKMASSQAVSYQLDKVINATKADEQIFRSIVDPILSGDISVPYNYFLSPPGYLATATAVVVSVNVMFSFWLAYRLRLTVAALTVLMSHAPPVHSRSLPPYLIASIPTTSYATIPPLQSVLPDDFYSYVFIILAVIYVISRVCRCRSFSLRASPSFDIYLEIKANRKCMFLKLQTVMGCPAEYLVTGSVLCSDLRVSGYLRPKLCVKWADFEMTHKPTERSLVLSEHYRLTIFQRFKLSAMMTNDFVCLLFFKHDEHAFYVSL